MKIRHLTRFQPVVVLLLLLKPPPLIAVCSRGEFGYKCSGYCYCKNKSGFNDGCNPYTGKCFRSGCEPGFSGNYCQMRPLLTTEGGAVHLVEGAFTPAPDNLYDVVDGNRGTLWNISGFSSNDFKKGSVTLKLDSMSYIYKIKLKLSATITFQQKKFCKAKAPFRLSCKHGARVYFHRDTELKTTDECSSTKTINKCSDKGGEMMISKMNSICKSQRVQGYCSFAVDPAALDSSCQYANELNSKAECFPRMEVNVVHEKFLLRWLDRRDFVSCMKIGDIRGSIECHEPLLGQLLNFTFYIRAMKALEIFEVEVYGHWTKIFVSANVEKPAMATALPTFDAGNKAPLKPESAGLLNVYPCNCKVTRDCKDKVPLAICKHGCSDGRNLRPPECQAEFPRLVEAPVLIERTENTIRIKFKQWNWNTDIGHGPPTFYSVEARELSTIGAKWIHKKKITHKALTETEAAGALVDLTLTGVSIQNKYEIRVVAGTMYYATVDDKTKSTEYENPKKTLKLTRLHGAWSSWQDWESCRGDLTTYGLQSRERRCDNPVPSDTGDLCEGNMDGYRKCPPKKGMETVKKRIQGPNPTLHMAYRKVVAVKFIHPTIRSDELTPDVYEIEYREVGREQPYLLDRAQFATMENKGGTIATIPVKPNKEYDVNVFAAYHFGGNKLQRIAGKASNTLRVKGGQGCKAAFFGKDCANKCHCEDDKTCNEANGECPGGCDKYYDKDQQGACTSHKGCPPGWWGEKCDQKCNCENDANCENAETGECPNGICKPRFTGSSCSTKTKCKAPKVYGPDCKTPCHCLNDAQCDDYTGKCDQCPPGFRGESCSIKTDCMETFDFYPPSPDYPYKTFYCVDVPLLEVSFKLDGKVDNDMEFNQKVLFQLESTLGVVQSRISSLLVSSEKDGQRVKLFLQPNETAAEKLSSTVLAKLKDLIDNRNSILEYPPGNKVKAKAEKIHLKPVLEAMDKAKMIRILANIDKQTMTEVELTAVVDDFFQNINPTFSQDKSRYKNPFVSPGEGKLIVELFPPVTKATTFTSTVLRRLQKTFHKDGSLKDDKGNVICTIKGGTVTYDLGPKVIPAGEIPDVEVSFFVKCKLKISELPKVYGFISNTVQSVMGVTKERITNLKSSINGKLTLMKFVLLKKPSSSSKSSRDALNAWNTKVYSGQLKLKDDYGKDLCDVYKQVTTCEVSPLVTGVTDKIEKVELTFTLDCKTSAELKNHVIESLSRDLGVAKSRLSMVAVLKTPGGDQISVAISPPTKSSPERSSEIVRKVKTMVFYGELKIKDGDVEVCTTPVPTNRTVVVTPVGPDPQEVIGGKDNKIVIAIKCDSLTFDRKEQLATDALAEVMQVQTDRIVNLKFVHSGSKAVLEATLRPPTSTSPKPNLKAMKWLQEVVKAKAFIIKNRNGDTSCTGTDLIVNPIVCQPGFWGEKCKNPCNCENDAPCENQRTGDCPGGRCKKRFTGPGCATKIKCTKPMVYGPDCNKPCNCFNNVQCDDYSGKCDKCPSGYSGEDCSIKTTCTETFDFYPPSASYPFTTFLCVDVPLLEISFKLDGRVNNDVDVNTKALRALEKTLQVAKSRITSLVVAPDGGEHLVNLYLRPPSTSSEKLDSEVIATLSNLVNGENVVFEHPVGNKIKAKTDRLHIKPVLEEPDRVKMVRIIADINKNSVVDKDLKVAVEDFFRHINPTFKEDKTRYTKPYVSPRGKLIVELRPPVAKATTFSSTVIKRLQQVFNKDSHITDGQGNTVFTVKGGTVTYDVGPKTVPPGVVGSEKVKVSFFVKCQLQVSSGTGVFKYIAITLRTTLDVSKERIADMTSTAHGEYTLITFNLLAPTGLSTKLSSRALHDWNTKVYEGSVVVVDDQGKTVCTVPKQVPTIEPTTSVTEIVDKLSKVVASFRLICSKTKIQTLEDHLKESLPRILGFAKTRLEKTTVLKRTDGYHVSVVIQPPTKFSTKKSSEILASLNRMLFNGELKVGDANAEVCTTDPKQPALVVDPVGPEPPGVSKDKDNKVSVTLDCTSTKFDNKEQLATDALVDVTQVKRERIASLKFHQSGSKTVLEFTLRPPTATSPMPSGKALMWLQAAVNEKVFVIKNKDGNNACKGTAVVVNPKTKCPDGMYGPDCSNKCNCDPGQPCNHLGKCEPKIKCPEKTFGEQCKYNCDCTDSTAVCPPEILGCESKCKSVTKGTCKVVCAAGLYGEDCSKRCDCKVTIACVDGKCTKDKTCDNPMKYGIDCDLECRCAEGSACSRAEGLCKSCKPLRYGEDCGNECGCLKASLCNSKSGSCNGICLKGRWGLDCKNECFCEDCNSFTGKCKGVCPDGRYGPRCGNECHCEDQKPCTISAGCIGCDFGFRGHHCNLKCFCKDKSSCSQYRKCPHCPSGRYGLTCEHECDGCVAGDCDRYTGECRRGCKPERWGAGCKNKCACRLPGTCNSVDGHCTSGCVKGRTGPACSNLCYCEKDEYCIDNTCDFRCPKHHYGHDCKNVSHCPPGDTYDLHTGRCSSGNCDEGFFGPACSSRCHCKENRCKPTGECLQGGCAEGWYGPSCSHRCNCVDGTKCDSSTGACEKCPIGWYGIDCSKQCFCRENVACNRHTGFCANGCPPLRYGLACDRLCACYDGDICERFSGTCCKPSNPNNVCSKEPTCDDKMTYGPNCGKTSNCQGNFNRLSGECSTCKTGYYGYACENQCHCKGNSGCSSDGNRCASGCEAGWFGFHCEKPCHCKKKAPCEKGKCNTGCEAGWWGYSCDRPCNCESPTCNQDTGYCDGECIPGKFGESCDQSCFCPDDGRCMRKTGKCTSGVCPPNRFGYGCQKQCHCLPGSECVKGFCEKGCDKGWSGPNCQTKCNCRDGMCNSEKCVECLPGTFGPRCETKCHCAGKCKELTNECEECSLGSWGLDCQHECHCKSATPCDKLSGRCPSDCEDGYFGNACDRKCHCRNGGRCEQFTGECITGMCELGYYGLGCQDKCNCARPCDQKTGKCDDGCLFRHYGDTCKNESNCSGPFDPITGKCTTVCRPGWYGYNCAQKCNCDEETVGNCHAVTGECSNGCPPTYYGYNCKNRCYCLDNNGRCPRDTGECSNCVPGWSGPRCDTRCHCERRVSCPKGMCPGDCERGWRGKGCSEPIPCPQPNKYGKACTMVCHCLENKPCHRFTGKCIKCKPKWKGVTCSHFEGCDKPNVYGQDCGSECQCLTPDHCDSFTGSCGGICPPQRGGDKCDVQTKCPDRTFGEQCRYKCHCSDPTAVCPPEILDCGSNCKSVTKNSCKVVCAAGYYGEDCSNKCNCKTTIACVDGKCTKDKICDNPKKYGIDCDLDCQCAEGSACTRAEGLCKSCKPLRYGEDCGNECGCLKASLCNSKTGSCNGICLKGRWGLDCKNECFCEDCNSITGRCKGICPDGRYGPRCGNECHCEDKKPCTISAGCIGCDFGFRGYHCNLNCFCKDMTSCSQYDKCPHCPSGRYGQTCEHECDGCMAGDCDRYTGECRRGCKPERWGAGCKNKCACRLPGTCNPIDGYCPSGCLKGRTGPACNTTCNCEKDEYCVDNTCDFRCPKYHYGHDCRNVSHCPPGDTYDLHTGRCSSGICDEGFFGPACSSRCHCKEKRCKPTGECLQDGCAEGWYGPSCSYRCNCVDLTKCDSATGACEKCPVGWYGIDCSKQCFCRENVACNRHTGFCPNGCPPLRYGLACDRICACYDGDVCERFSGTCCKPSNPKGACSKEPTCKDKNTYGPNCDKKSNCQGNFNRLSGECSTCKTGYYGFACENRCHCKGNTGCSGDGNRCASGCDVGWFGFYCEKPCHCYKKAPCEKGKCNTGCEAGWWGYSCDRPCNCESPTCNQQTGYCDGECIPGKFGYSCDQQCFCPDVGRCMRKTGKCAGGVCPPNRFGYGCQNQCHCLPGSVCIKGFCEKGCDKGWSGPNCQTKCNCRDGKCNTEKCVKCLPGTFGPRCETKCHCVGKCKELTNECEKCSSGRWGLDCQQECHCNSATPCDRLSGKCPSDCQDGYFGYACDQKCHCRNGGRCEQFTGECINGICEVGYYGLGCQDKCNCARPCDQKTGKCDDGCLFRRYGDTCKNESNCSGPFDPITGKCTTVCRPGWYGYNCAQKCNCDEETVGNCHAVTGECSNGCPPTYYGYNCKNRCYCLDNNGRCPRDTGECSNCLHGWFGPRCDTPCHCRQRESCAKGVCPGDCEPGWRGKGCSEPIPCPQPNRYGKACTMVCHCLENKPCHRFTGKCNKCKPRWKGDTCSHFEACEKPNVYGEDCGSECRCMTPDHCDSFTGSCRGVCPPRLEGDKCDVPTGCTLPGTFGEKCEHKCHCKQSTCDDETGSCKDHGGCAEYFSGDNCSTFKIPEQNIGSDSQHLDQTDKEAEMAEKENKITIAVGGICALVVVCCISLVIFIYVAKTHKSQLDLELVDDDEEPENDDDDQLKTRPQSKTGSVEESNMENTSMTSAQVDTPTETPSIQSASYSFHAEDKQ